MSRSWWIAVACVGALGIAHCRPRPGRGGQPTGMVVGEVEVPPRRTINDLRVEPGRYQVRLDATAATFWLIGGKTYHFPAAVRTSAAPVTAPTIRLAPAGDSRYLDADIPPDRNWTSYKSTAPI